ncbi:MAG: malate dehydrogenase [Pseudomonadota bacterium]|jgi:malate dehydrogenase
MGRKVSIIGAGNVGATIAHIMAISGICHEIVLRDSQIGVAKGKALDMSQAAQVVGSHSTVKASDLAHDIADSNIVVVTAGIARKPGMSRDDLLLINAGIMKSIAKDIKEHAPNAIVIVISNPVDAMTLVMQKATGFDKKRVIGMAGILDAARMATFIQEKLGYCGGQIVASVIGGHGDDMVPLPRYCSVAGLPLSDLLNESDIYEIVERTRNGGAEIVELLQTGSAYYAPAKATSLMIESILNNTRQIYPCGAFLNGEYGYSNVVSGVPVLLGINGIEKIIEIPLNDTEKEAFKKSVESVQELIAVLDKNNFWED